MGIREKLRLLLIRRATPLVIGWYWRGAKATALTVSNTTMPVQGGTIHLRIYKPLGAGPFPVLHFFHGGGWIFGDLDSHDAVCRDLCVQAGRLVIAVDYRMAPEYPFPIPIEDCLASLAWTRDKATCLGGDIEDIVICGDSAGGNLAAVAAQQARKLFPGMLKGQLLIYPVTDHSPHASWPSYKAYSGPKYGLTHDSMNQLWRTYLRASPLWTAGMTQHELATPLHTADLSDLPRTLLVLAEKDVLHDEGADYARRLNEAGIPAQVKVYAGQMHGFVGLKPTAPYRQAMADMAAWLKAG